jgi:Cof subfamily protein (haloacid dehalogenase superfamily)
LIRLIGIDVDGTLVGSTGIVDPVVWRAAERARAAGIHLAICSGRPAFGLALNYAQRLDPDGWHIFQNGASVVDLASGRSRSRSLPGPSVEFLIAQARSTGRILELYSDRSYAVESVEAWAQEHADLLGVPFEPKPLESLQPPIVRAQWLVSPETALQAMAEASTDLEVAQSTSPLMPDTRFVGLTPAGVNKGSAIQSVAAQYGCTLQEVMYVGDADNDLSALRIVGCPVAMANASASVLKIARHSVSHVDAGGLAEALELAMAGR